MNQPILWIDQMVFLIDPSIVNNIIKVNFDMSQRFLQHVQEGGVIIL